MKILKKTNYGVWNKIFAVGVFIWTITLVSCTRPTTQNSEPDPVFISGEDEPEKQISIEQPIVNQPTVEQPGEFWWNNWPRFTLESNFRQAATFNAQVLTSAQGLSDEGRAPYFREITYRGYASDLSESQRLGFKRLAWIEGQGQTRAIIAGIRQNPDGTYLWDNSHGAAKVLSHNWMWDHTGLGKDPLLNKVVWFSVASFANGESWLGPYTIQNSHWKMNLPRAVSGALAIDTGGITGDPRNSKFYNATAAKDLNGKISVSWEQAGDHSDGKIMIPNGETSIPVGDFSFGKDMAYEWWIDYNVMAATDQISKGGDGFWVDNYSGFDSTGSTPIRTAFGDWSVHKYNEYLQSHPVSGVNFTPGFNVRNELKSAFRKYFPDQDPNDLTSPGWIDSVWMTDPLWRSYLVFKAEVSTKAAENLHRKIKDAAKNLGLNPNMIYVGGNDIPMVTYGAIRGDSPDQVNTEYSSSWSLDVGGVGRGLPPTGGTGTFYKSAVNLLKSPLAVVWFYLENEHARFRARTGLGKILGLEAIMNNVILNSGGSPHVAGTTESAHWINNVIEFMGQRWGQRKIHSKLGLVMSTETIYSTLSPGGSYESDHGDGFIGLQDHTRAFYGWGGALEDLKVPYMVVPDIRLNTETLKDLSVLILPHVGALDSNTINSVFIPFLERGGQLVITGENSGWQSTQKGHYQKNSKTLIATLMQRRDLKSHIHILSENPGRSYYEVRNSLSTSQKIQHLKWTTDLLESLTQIGPNLQTVVFDQLHADVHITTHVRRQPRFTYFLDILNRKFNLENDRWSENPEKRVTVELPIELSGTDLAVVALKADSREEIKVSWRRLAGRKIEISLPPFLTMVSIVISPHVPEEQGAP